ncbi:1-acyl-sn-glycerol-3-phosphate acyltransferase [Granulicella sp. S190]|uniref:lysophospholipid acyltransferase family protein n=1 Tax=Granulicella sp. S190 TaxID=1747226 RepID=UPI00131AE420|nr:lysophospholipid acyltransferase family protein [Granulicella sp. S190]
MSRTIALWRFTRSVWRSFLFVGLLVAAVVDCRVRRPRVGAEGAVWIHGWCRRIVRVLGFECSVEGRVPSGGAVVSNHLSYLDILLYSSVQPFVMVAKTEVRGWPLLGWLTAQAGTVYVERGGGPPTYPQVNAAMAEAYRSGLPVLFFPEGTTTPGGGVLPFRRGLFHSVLKDEIPLRVAALRYALDSHVVNGDATVGEDVCWWGDMEFAPHMFQFLGLQGLQAQIRFGEEIIERVDRFVLSESAQGAVAEMYEELGLEAGARLGWEHDSELVEAL